jgi:hypothetical protein
LRLVRFQGAANLAVRSVAKAANRAVNGTAGEGGMGVFVRLENV